MYGKNYKMPGSFKRVLSTITDSHLRGEVKRLMIKSHQAELAFKNRRRSAVEKEVGGE